MNRIARATIFASLAAALILGTAEAAKRAKHRPKPPPQDVVIVTGIRAAVPVTAVRAAWTQYGPSGALEARAVVDGKYCPDIALDLNRKQMERRAEADGGFLTVCSAVIPNGTKQAALAFFRMEFKSPPPVELGDSAMAEWYEREFGVKFPVFPDDASTEKAWNQRIEAKRKYDLVPLPLPVSDPQRIVVFGDTGCRIKGTALQDCSDPEAWPFPRIAAEAAKLKPDLVIHVGDYLYRENACPANFNGCTGTPFGDNWPTWDADFFAPAGPLLAAAPWVIVRGNHEDCQRAGPGFLRLLGPSPFDPAVPCSEHLAPYSIPLDRMTLVVADNADAPETSVAEAAVPAHRAEIAVLAQEKAPVWWLLHRPIWGVISGPLGLPVGGNQTMIKALNGAGIPASVDLMLSGHIHTFEVFNYDPKPHVPPQIVAGFGGDRLDPTPADLKGSVFQGASGVSVHDGLSLGGFGFLLMTRGDDGWRIDVYDTHGRIVRICTFAKGRVDCPATRR